MVSNIDIAHSWYVWKPTNIETLLSQQMNMIQAARRIFDEKRVPREHHNDILKQPIVMGSDCVKEFVAKLRTRYTTWDHDLYTLIRQQMEAIKPAHLSYPQI